MPSYKPFWEMDDGCAGPTLTLTLVRHQWHAARGVSDVGGQRMKAHQVSPSPSPRRQRVLATTTTYDEIVRAR